MKRPWFYCSTAMLTTLVMLCLTACSAGSPQPRTPAAHFTLQSPAIKAGSPLASRFTCDGQDISPALSFTAIPPGTKTLALSLTDPDAPGGTFTHWLLWNLPTSTTNLPQGLPQQAALPATGGARQGTNDFGRLGYNGPCPPAGQTHHYHFTAYALDQALQLPSSTKLSQFQQQVREHQVARVDLIVTYQRR